MLASALWGRLANLNEMYIEPISMAADPEEDTGSKKEVEDVLLYFTAGIELILMTTLLVISSTFLIKQCCSKQKTASFITKLLILVTLVAISGILNAIRDAPLWNNFEESLADIIFCCSIGFVYWVGA